MAFALLILWVLSIFRQIVKQIYVGLIVVVIGFMVIHNGLDFVRRAKIVAKKREESE